MSNHRIFASFILHLHRAVKGIGIEKQSQGAFEKLLGHLSNFFKNLLLLIAPGKTPQKYLQSKWRESVRKDTLSTMEPQQLIADP